MAEKSEWAVELDDDVTPGARRAERSLGRLQRAFDRFNRSGVAKSVQRFASAAKEILAVGAAVGAGVAAAVTGMTVSMVDFNQRSRLAFSQLAKAGEVPEELFMRSIDLAKQFGLDIKDTTKQIAKFRALQFSQDQAESLIKAGADMQALGASTEEVTRIFSQLGQIQAKGKLQGEELIVLAENGLSTQLVYENLEKQLGKTREEILKMQQAGEIDASSALNAISAAILEKTGSSQLGEAGARVAQETLSGMGGRLRAGFQDMFRRAADQAEPAIVAALAPIGERLNAIFEDPQSAQMIADVVAAIGEAIQAALPFIDEFLDAFGEGFAATMPAIMEGFEVVIDLLREFGGDADRTTDTVRLVGRALGEIAAILAGTFVAAVGIAAAVIATLAAAWEGLKQSAQVVTDAIGSIVFAIEDFFADINAIVDSEKLTLFEKMVEVGKDMVRGVAQGLLAVATLPQDTIGKLGGMWVSGLKSVLGIASPSKVFEQIGRNVTEGFNIGVAADMPTVGGMASEIGANDNAGAALASGGGGGNVFNFSPQISVPISGSATREDGEELGAGLEGELRRQFNSWIEDVALEFGT